MMASFESWLIDLLNSKNIDGDVFGEYISGTLDTMEDFSQEEIEEALVEIISGCVEDDKSCSPLCQEIMERWLEEKQKRKEINQELKTEGLPSSHLASLPIPTATSSSREASAGREQSKQSGLSSVEKERLLAQYGCELIEEDVNESASETVSTGASKGIDSFENINRSSIVDEQRMMRESQKAAHDIKVVKDKQDRLSQKQKVQDRKEKEKKRTQKQERRR